MSLAIWFIDHFFVTDLTPLNSSAFLQNAFFVRRTGQREERFFGELKAERFHDRILYIYALQLWLFITSRIVVISGKQKAFTVISQVLATTTSS